MGRKRKIVDSAVVLDAALGLIEAEGLEGFSTRRLSAALGLSPMTIYNYYENAEAILVAVALRGLEEWHRGYSDLLLSMEEARGHPVRAFRALASELYRFGLERPHLYLFLFESSLAEVRKDPRIGEWYRRLLDRCEVGAGEPGLREAFHSDVYLFEVLANGLVISTIRRRLVHDEARFRRLVDRAYERFLAPYEAWIKPD